MLIEPAQPHDRDFIFHSWLQSYRRSPATHAMADYPYYLTQQKTAERLVARSRVAVVRPVDWPEGVIGWVCAEQQDSAFVLHYGYVKGRYRATRTRGPSFFWGLVESMEPRGELLFTHLRPPFTNTLTKHGYSHAPERAGKATP